MKKKLKLMYLHIAIIAVASGTADLHSQSDTVCCETPMARANSFCVILESVRNFLMILSNLYILHLKDIITLLVAQISPFLQSLIKLLFLEKCCIIL